MRLRIDRFSRLVLPVPFLLLGVLALVAGPALAGSVLFSTMSGIDPVSTYDATSQRFVGDMAGYRTAAADDFTVTDNAWTIRQVDVLGEYGAGTMGIAESINLYILGVSGSLPDTTNLSAGSIYAVENWPYRETGSGDFSIPLPGSGVTLGPGTYFLVVQANMPAGVGTWGWKESASMPNSGTAIGFESAWFQAPEVRDFLGCLDTWGARQTTCDVEPSPDPSPPLDPDLAFQLLGDALTPGVEVSRAQIFTVESGISDAFEIVLTSPPLPGETVTIDIDDSADAGEGMAAESSVMFTGANWNIPRTVTVQGIDDAIADGDVSWMLALDPVVSGDGGYAGFDPADVAVINLDDEIARIIVDPASGLTLSENGGSAQLDIFPTTPPTDDVAVPLTVSLGRVSVVASVVLPSGSTAAQTVQVNGVDDDIRNFAESFTVTTGDPTSAGDAVYDALTANDVVDVLGTVQDDESASIDVTSTPSPLMTNETDGGRGGDTVSVVLTSEPTADVVLDLAPSDPSEVSLSESMLTFTAGNWDTPQAVTVLGIEDNIIDGDVDFVIVIAPSESSDPVYDGLAGALPTGTNVDSGVPVELQAFEVE